MSRDRFGWIPNARPLGLTLAHAAYVRWTYSSAKLYELLVLRCGMPPRQYGRFIADTMIDTLFPSKPPYIRV
jgi:hypothetical protein